MSHNVLGRAEEGALQQVAFPVGFPVQTLPGAQSPQKRTLCSSSNSTVKPWDPAHPAVSIPITARSVPTTAACICSTARSTPNAAKRIPSTTRSIPTTAASTCSSARSNPSTAVCLPRQGPLTSLSQTMLTLKGREAGS